MRVYGALSIMVVVLAAVAGGARADVPGYRASSGSATRFALRGVGLPDSLLRIESCEGNPLGRLWERGELERLAERIRDRLAGRGRYDATLRLSLVVGSGSAPGVATLALFVPASIAAESARGEGSRPPIRTPHAIAVIAPGPPTGMVDPVRSFARGSRGAASPEAIFAGMAAVRDDAVAEGRYAATVTIDSIIPAGDEVRVHLRVAAGPPVVVETLELPGATTTRPGAAASIAGLKSGRRVTPSLLAEARERLIGSDLFTIVGEARVLPGREPGGARVLIPVEELNSSHFEGALGIAKAGGVTGLIDIGLGNIGGSGRVAGARWAGLGDGHATYSLRYREPALFGKQVDASASLDADVADSLFTQTRWSLAFGGRPVPRTHASLALVRSGSVYSGMGRGSSDTWSVLGRLGWQGLSPRPNPSRGISGSLEFEAGHRIERYPGFPETRRGLLRGKASVASAVPIGGARVLFAALRAEEVSLGDGDFPAEELLYLGGSEGLRGHRDRAYAGNKILALNMEHRWITDSRDGRAYLFFDSARHMLDAPVTAGVAGGTGASASLARTELSDGWGLGYGAGVQTRMASGVAGLELGLRPGAALREATIHVRYASSW